MPHQQDFVEDITTPQLLLRGGFYSGKTYAAIYKTIYLAWLNVGYTGLIVEPTENLLNEHWAPEFEAVIDELGIQYEVTRRPLKYFLHFPEGVCKLLGHSANNHERIVGFNCAFAIVDELDTLKSEIAEACWKAVTARVRKGNVLQKCAVTTPEGFRYCYKNWIKDDNKYKRNIKAITKDNPAATQDYIDELSADYTDQQIEAWLTGEFVNMTQGRVYYAFERKYNSTSETLERFDTSETLMPIHVGVDFNIGKMSAIVHVIDEETVYAVNEHLGGHNTESLIETIQRCYPDRHITIYPDSSGKSNKSNSSQTDIKLLENAFGQSNVKYPKKNPFVSNRVGAMNAMFKNARHERRYLINANKCPDYMAAVEQQAYNNAGEPDKRKDLDHPIDGAGYFIYFMFPLKRTNSKPLKLGGY